MILIIFKTFFQMNPNATPFVPSKIRTDIPLETIPHFNRYSKSVCQCMVTRCSCCQIHILDISVYNDTITVYDETHAQFFYLEGDLSLRAVLAYLGYTGNDISIMDYGLLQPQLNEDATNDGVDDIILDSLVMTMKPTQVALQ